MKDGEDLQTSIHAQHQMWDQSILRQYHLHTITMCHLQPVHVMSYYSCKLRGPNALPRGIPPLTKPHDEKESLYILHALEMTRQITLKP